MTGGTPISGNHYITWPEGNQITLGGLASWAGSAEFHLTVAVLAGQVLQTCFRQRRNILVVLVETKISNSILWFRLISMTRHPTVEIQWSHRSQTPWISDEFGVRNLCDTTKNWDALPTNNNPAMQAFHDISLPQPFSSNLKTSVFCPRSLLVKSLPKFSDFLMFFFPLGLEQMMLPTEIFVGL